MTLLRPAPRLPLPGTASDRRERRRLVLEDRRGALLATLASVREVLVGADAVVTAGWAQEALYVSRDGSGREWACVVASPSIRVEAVTRACLVGAVVLAAGGPEVATGQPARRSIEAVWHALARREHEPVDWCPPAVVHARRVRDLARWNDSPRRSVEEVHALLQAGQRIVARERERVLAA
jgi:hypothetical protein